MQLLLGLCFFSILLTTGSSTKCAFCVAINGRCSDVKEVCPSGDHVCMSLKLKSKDDKDKIIYKSCSPKDECKQYENGTWKELPQIISCIPNVTAITEATCSRAPPSFASFFPAFLGLLLMKLLF